MAIQTKLDKTKSFGKVISIEGAAFTQSGLKFDGRGRRISEITKEEALAEIANEAAEAARAEAMRAGDEAAAAVLAADERVDTDETPEVESKDMPDFEAYTKNQMINYAAEKFHVKVDPKLNKAPMVKLMQGLY